MRANEQTINQMMPAVRDLAASQAAYQEGQLGIPERLMVRGDDLIVNKGLVNLLGNDTGPLLTYYTEAENFNRERDAFLDFLNTGPSLKPKSVFYNRVQGFYVTFRNQMGKVADAGVAARAITDRHRSGARRNTVAKSIFFYGMFFAAVIVSIVYLIVRRVSTPAPWMSDPEGL
jgi:hypothetical protein